MIGSEECERSIAKSAMNPSKKNWESYLRLALGPNYFAICSHTLQAIHIMAFAHKAIMPIISEVVSGAVATGMGNTLGNKGGAAISLKIGKTRIVSLNCHLSAHHNQVKERNEQMNKIDREMTAQILKKNPQTASNAAPSASAKVAPTSIPEDEAVVVVGADLKPRTPQAAPVGTGSPKKSNAVAPAYDIPKQQNFDLPPTSKNPASGVIDANRTQSFSPAHRAQATIEANRAQSFNVGRLNPANNSFVSMQKASCLSECADAVVVMGDLNYRIRGTR